jgi:hypothetical protein
MLSYLFRNSGSERRLSAATGKYIHLSNHLFRNTCLLIGLSLEDSTLQSLLRQNAVTNPGHIHYIVQYTSPGVNDEPGTLEAIFQSNFSSYNLYTLFMDSEGIDALAGLISMNERQFELDFQDRQRKFVYYLVGSVGAGKSTATGNFRSLVTYDEWIDERRPALAIPEREVAPDEVSNIDAWVVEQFRKKNHALARSNEGIHLIDRCPMDPLTFGDPNKRPEKAKNLINRITKSLAPGHIIYLDCDIGELKIRNSFKHRYWPDDDYEALLSALRQIYGPMPKSEICTRGRGIEDVARQIAQVVFLDDYQEVDILDRLKSFSDETQ